MTSDIEVKERVFGLLPFYVNDTLTAQERVEVDAVLAEDVNLRREVELLSLIRDEVKEEDVEFSPGEFGLARLRRAIDDSAAEPRRGLGMVATSAAAAAVLIVGSFVYLSKNDGEPSFIQAGADANAGDLVVAFHPSAAEGEIAELLTALDLSIVDGPSAIGLYRLAVSDTRDVGEVMAVLAAKKEVIESVDSAE